MARRITGGLILAYLIFLACVWAGTRLVGERNLTTAFLLYLPPGVWVLPAVFLAPLGLRFHRKGFCAMCGFFCLAIWFGRATGRDYASGGNILGFARCADGPHLQFRPEFRNQLPAFQERDTPGFDRDAGSCGKS